MSLAEPLPTTDPYLYWALYGVAAELRRVMELTGHSKDPAIVVTLRKADNALKRGRGEPIDGEL